MAHTVSTLETMGKELLSPGPDLCFCLSSKAKAGCCSGGFPISVLHSSLREYQGKHCGLLSCTGINLTSCLGSGVSCHRKLRKLLEFSAPHL